MEHTHETLDAPCPACVKKVVNNGNFIAALAPILAVRSASKLIRDAATRLAQAAGAYSKMLASYPRTLVIKEWEGCAEAKLLMQWIDDEAGPAGYDERSRSEELDKLTGVIWAASRDLVHGKLPT